MNARQKLRIEGLISQHRVHQLENPLIEDLDFVRYEQGGPRPGAWTASSCCSTSRWSRRSSTPTAARWSPGGQPEDPARAVLGLPVADGKWLLDDVEQPGEGARHMKAPLVGDDYATLSPESILRERYARGEIEIEEFEAEMAKFLGKEQTY